jgi:hypothetical protein
VSKRIKPVTPTALQKARAAVASARITEWVTAKHAGNVRAAAEALGVDYSALWRAASGSAVKGPTVNVLLALVKHAGQTTAYWTGR